MGEKGKDIGSGVWSNRSVMDRGQWQVWGNRQLWSMGFATHELHKNILVLVHSSFNKHDQIFTSMWILALKVSLSQ